jgi:hypothetical protein
LSFAARPSLFSGFVPPSAKPSHIAVHGVAVHGVAVHGVVMAWPLSATSQSLNVSMTVAGSVAASTADGEAAAQSSARLLSPAGSFIAARTCFSQRSNMASAHWSIFFWPLMTELYRRLRALTSPPPQCNRLLRGAAIFIHIC